MRVLRVQAQLYMGNLNFTFETYENRRQIIDDFPMYFIIGNTICNNLYTYMT